MNVDQPSTSHSTITDAQDPSPPSGPKPIQKLEEAVVNRIAAGEIIHRPANALKELMENSLDAGATSIKLTLKDGGHKLLQIQDNGHGINHADLPILCERFTTSKIRAFEDLGSIATYGFRGEALASISHVAHLSVVTKMKKDSNAWRACYADGELAEPKPGAGRDPKPTAGNDGTTLTVEDLFYNVPTRKRALKSPAEEYNRILDVVTRYAVHNAGVAFVCKKVGSNIADVSTSSAASTIDNIKALYGASVARELVHFKHENEPLRYKAEGYVTSANYSVKRTTFLLFINHRLVDHTPLKRQLEEHYSKILPKGGHPFIYLALEIEPAALDVNVHPTKSEVRFLDEDEIVTDLADRVSDALAEGNLSRTYGVQMLLPGASQPAPSASRSGSGGVPKSSMNKPAPKNMIRTDTTSRTLDSMFPVLDPLQAPSSPSDELGPSAKRRREAVDEARFVAPPGEPGKRAGHIAQSECRLTSVKELRAEVARAKHSGMADILAKHTFVGIVDLKLSLSLIQHETKLYIVNHCELADELFYQLGLRQFGAIPRMRLSPPPPIRTLVQLAAEHEPTVRNSPLGINGVIDHIVDILMDRREMLDEYFSMCVNEAGDLESLPMLLPKYTPDLDRLPLFLLRLGPQVDWTSEMGCFSSFLHELAYFYAPFPLTSASEPPQDAHATAAEESRRWQIQHVVFPALASSLVPPKRLLERDVAQVASLPDLYRIFERC